MNTVDIHSEQSDAGHARLPYETPRLVSHGTLEKITQDIGKNSGAGDIDLQSGGAG